MYRSDVNVMSECLRSKLGLHCFFQVLTALLLNGYTDIKAGLKLTDNFTDDASKKANRKAHLSLFKYCDDFLRRHEDGNNLFNTALKLHEILMFVHLQKDSMM